MGWSLALVIILLLLIVWHSNKKPKKNETDVAPNVSNLGNSSVSSVSNIPTPHCHVRLYPDAFWEADYVQAPPGFGLSSGEIQFQLPHPQDPHDYIEQKKQWQQIDCDRKRRIGYSTKSCESPADWMTKASGYTSYLWQQPAPIMNYFKPSYPEDDASDRSVNNINLESHYWYY